MGSTFAASTSDVVLPEILTFSGDDVLLVHGSENGNEFWWPPGSYWVAERACDLRSEQPEEWVRRVIRDQVQVSLSGIRLRSVEFIDRTHPPVLVYEVQTSGTPRPSTKYGFDATEYFPVSALPEHIGRDKIHGKWLKGLLEKTRPLIQN